MSYSQFYTENVPYEDEKASKGVSFGCVKCATVKLTNSDKANFERFGCTFRDDSFCINWKGKRSSQAESAEVYACLARVNTTSGPVVLLAFEIAAIRPLPNYCYFPFDLKKQVHRNYLSRLTDDGEIKLRFFTEKLIGARTHRFTPYLLSRATQVLAEATQQLESIEERTYDFQGALRLIERHVRVPDFLNRPLLEDTVKELTERIAVAVETVPGENRELANRVIDQVADAFKPYYQRNRNAVHEFIRNAPKGLTYISDFHRVFADDPAGLIRFLRDALAATYSSKELEGLNELIMVALALLSFFREEQALPEPEPLGSFPTLPPGMIELVRSMKTSGISKDAASRLLQLIGLEVGGKPGRPVKDYSREYDLKASGLSWTKVTRHAMQENADIRQEFGGRNFQALTFGERTNLTNRIREGVRSYAERTGKPFPIESVGNAPDHEPPAEK